MKVASALAGLVSDLSGMGKAPPDFNITQKMASTSGTSTPRKNSAEMLPPQERRHSIMITVGADVVPVVKTEEKSPIRNRSDSISNLADEQHAKFMKSHAARRASAPCNISNAQKTSLKLKLNKMKRTDSSGSEKELKEEDEEPCSSALPPVTYQLV